MSAVAAVVASRQPSIHLRSTLSFEEYSTVRLSHSWDEDAGTPAAPRWTTRTRKADVPFAPDATDKERLLRVVHEYKDSLVPSRLNFTQGPDIYDNFRLVLGGDLRTTWDQTITELEATQVPDGAGGHNPWAKTANNFIPDGITKFLRRFFPSNAFLIQGEYMRLVMKPKALDVYAVSGRVRLINTLSQYLPGSNRQKLYTTPVDEKNAFFRMMLPSWQLKFTETGQELDDPNYTYDRLVQFMANQQLYHDAQQEANRQQRARNSQGFRRIGGRFGQQTHPGVPPPPPPPYYGGRGFGSPGFRGGRGNGPSGGRSFTPHRNSHLPHQSPAPTPAARGGRGYQGRNRSTYTTPRTRYQQQQQRRQTRSGRGYGGPPQHPPARRQLFYADQHYNDHYFAGDEMDYEQQDFAQEDPHQEQDQFFAAAAAPTSTTFAAVASASAPAVQEHHYSSSAPADEQDHYFADGNEEYETYGEPNDWLQDY